MSGEMGTDVLEQDSSEIDTTESVVESAEEIKERELREIIEEVRADAIHERGQLFINKNLLVFVDDLVKHGISRTDIERTRLYKILLNQEEPNGHDPLDIPGNYLEAFVHTLSVK